MSNATYDVVAIGNALVDVLATVTDAFLQEQHDKHGLVKGSMTLIDEMRAAQLTAALTHTVNVPGGSVANTVAGIASFGGKAAYIGKVAEDAHGKLYAREMNNSGVAYQTEFLRHGIATGHCTILVSPDGQRTMNTFLGAAVTLGPDDVEESVIAGSRIAYLEGYLFDPEQAKKAFDKAAKLAHAAKRQVALSLSDSFCVNRHLKDFQNFVEGNVDILLANEDEILALRETKDFATAIAALKDRKMITAITRGARGSVIVGNGQTIEIAAAPVAEVVDTTGAGDQYAAGFLFGLSQGKQLEECGRLASLAAAEVIGHMGPRPEVSYAEFAKAA